MMKSVQIACIALACWIISIPRDLSAQQMRRADQSALALLDTIESRAKRYAEHHPVEKIHIHFDKSFYFLGDDCWFKAYVVSGSDLTPTVVSSVLYVDWLTSAGKVSRHQRIKIENGGGVGDIAIDTSFKEGTYVVRAYTSQMRYDYPESFYSREIQIIDPRIRKRTESSAEPLSSAIDVQFFPEGGSLVKDIQTQIAFRGTDGNGKGIKIEGEVLDEDGNLVATFRSSHNGMGEFPLQPRAMKSYKAVLRTGESFPLPPASDAGVTLAASNRSERELLVRVQGSDDYTSSSVYLIGHSGGMVCYAASIEIDGRRRDIVIPKENLPEGVLQLTLFDRQGVPRCERRLFVRKDRNLNIAIAADKSRYLPRDSVNLEFTVTAQDGSPVETALSVSVTDANLLSMDLSYENIFTRLLLQSDVRGPVENPRWYFEGVSFEKTYALDLVMRTHGWSRFKWEEILSADVQLPSNVPETGITLKGKMSDGKRPLSNTLFLLETPVSGSGSMNMYETDSLGNFSIDGIDFHGRGVLSWRVMGGRKGKVRKADILLDTLAEMAPVPSPTASDGFGLSGVSKPFAQMIDRIIRTHPWPIGAKVLDEIVITADKINVKVVGAGSILVKPEQDDLGSSTPQFIGRYALGVSSAKMVTTPDGERWTTHSGAPISIWIDGFESNTTGIGGNPYFILNSIPIEDVAFVIVTGDGHNGYNIAIGTKNDPVPPFKQLISITGYDAVREFYHPKYGPTDYAASDPDHRMTLYWNPNLKTDNQGKARAKFYNTDETKRLRVVAEGIANGSTISGTQSFGQ